MMYEYALDPALLNTYDRLMRFVSLFGFTQGRFISQYPTHWKKQILEGTDWKDVEKKRVGILLDRLSKEALHPRHQQRFDPAADWLQNALAEHQRERFRAVIAASTSASHQEVLIADDLDPYELPDLMQTGRGRQVVRTVEGMAAASRLWLSRCKKIQFVDRYIACKPNYLKPLRAILRDCGRKWPNGKPLPVDVEIHKSNETDDGDFGLWGQFKSELPGHVRLTVFVWESSYFHNRYLLTDVGGIQVGEGFKIAGEGDRPVDSWTPMDHGQTAEIARQFDCNTTAKKPALITKRLFP